MNEEEVNAVKRMQRGDEEAFSFLFLKYKNQAFRAAYLISGSRADSEDIVQETFVRCFLHRDKLRDAEKFESWMYQILTRAAWRHMKKKGREQPSETLWEDMEEVEKREKPLIDCVVEEESNRRLYEAVKKLDVKHRTTVVLYYFNQMSTKEIAAAMGCLEGTVKSRLFTARKNLKEALEQPEREGVYERRTV